MHRKLIALTSNARLDLAITIVSGLLSGLLTIWQAWLLSRSISAVFIGGQTLSQVTGFLFFALLAIIGRALLNWLSEIFSNSAAVKIKTILRNKLFTHIVKLGPAFSRGQRSGELSATAVEGVEALDAYFSQYLPQLVITALVPVTILIVVLPIDLLSGILFLITAPLIPFFMVIIGKGAEALTHRQNETLRLLSAHFLDSLQGLTTLKLFGQSKAQSKNIGLISDKFRDTTMGVLRITFLSALVLEMLATLSTAIIAVEIGFRLLYAKMDFQPALFLLILAPEFYFPLRALGARFHAGMSGTTAAKRIYEILDIPLGLLPADFQVTRLTPQKLTIELSDISFIYPNESTPALDRINLQIRAGQHIALIGPSGAGKTTLTNILLGFVAPTSGQIISSDGITSVYGPPAINDIAWVPQKPYLFNDTIAANIRLGNPQASDDQVIAAARFAFLDEFIESLPQKYETTIGENGARLSSGQAQRLALARAFLKNASILILDEPTSSLDPETEFLLEKSTHTLMQGRTVLTIAHRLHTIYQSDAIIVIESGRIVEQGTHRELLARQGRYAGMLNSKMIIEEPKTANFHKIEPEILLLPKQPSSIHLFDMEKHDKNILFRLLGFLKGSWGLVALSVFVGACTVGSSVALMGTSAWLISTAALHPSVAELGIAVVGVRFFGITRGLFRYSERLVSHDVTFRLLSRLRIWFYEKLEPLAPARLMEYHAGDLLARIISDVETLENFYVRVVSPPLVAFIVGSLTCIFLGSFNIWLSITFLIFFITLGFALPYLSQIISRLSAVELITLRAEMHTQLIDNIQGLADLVAYGQADTRITEIATKGTQYGKAQHHLALYSGFHSGLTTLLTNLGMWAILLISIPLVNNGTLGGPMLASCTLLTFAAFESVMPLPMAAQMWNSAREAARRLFEVVDAQPAVNDNAPYFSNDFPTSTIKFSNLVFSYPSQTIPALRNISFNIHKNYPIAIVGPSGAGKSSLANLLLRFWDYKTGEISLDSESIKLLAPDEVRARIGLVSQNTYFFNTTIRENLRFVRRQTTQEDIESGTRLAQIHDFIMGLPKGYDTVIGEQGMRLSGGERQRLGIARAIIKDAPILILDEPTANLDPNTEKQVLEILFEIMKRKTSLLITHRLVGLENMHEIIVMDHGQIVERGKHSQLIKMDGLYRRLWNLQMRILVENGNI